MRTARAARLIPVAAVAAVALGVALAPAAHATSYPSREDTMYVYDNDLGKRRGNDAEVCHFFFGAANFEPWQHASWWVENGSGADALRGTLTMDGTGAANTGPISLPNGTYKLLWETGTDGAKQFTVNCPQAPQQPAAGGASASASSAGPAAPSGTRRAAQSSSSPAQASTSASAGESAEPSGTPSGGGAVASAAPGATVTPEAGADASSGSGADTRSGSGAESGLPLGKGSAMAGAALLAVGGLLAVACLVTSEVLLRRSWRRR